MNNIVWPKWPQYGNAEQEAVLRVIRSNQIFADKEVRNFESEFSSYVGNVISIGVGNATQGLHLALAALGIGQSDEVIVTPYSWISSASCVLMQNATPIFCDIEPETLGLDPLQIEKKITNKTKAIIFVHMFGYPANVFEIQKLANKYNLYLIEDASHAHGLEINGVKAGNFGDISVFSLHQRKALSVGDGGIITTKHDHYAAKIQKLRSFGDEELSYNYRMTEFAGALGSVGLSKLDRENAIRRKNTLNLSSLIDQRYLKVRLTTNPNGGVYYATLLELCDQYVDTGIELVKKMNAIGIPIKKTWGLLNKHPHFNPKKTPARGFPLINNDEILEKYKDCYLPVAQKYCEHLIYELELHPFVSESNIEFSAKHLNDFFRNY